MSVPSYNKNNNLDYGAKYDYGPKNFNNTMLGLNGYSYRDSKDVDRSSIAYWAAVYKQQGSNCAPINDNSLYHFPSESGYFGDGGYGQVASTTLNKEAKDISKLAKWVGIGAGVLALVGALSLLSSASFSILPSFEAEEDNSISETDISDTENATKDLDSAIKSGDEEAIEESLETASNVCSKNETKISANKANAKSLREKADKVLSDASKKLSETESSYSKKIQDFKNGDYTIAKDNYDTAQKGMDALKLRAQETAKAREAAEQEYNNLEDSVKDIGKAVDALNKQLETASPEEKSKIQKQIDEKISEKEKLEKKLADAKKKFENAKKADESVQSLLSDPDFLKTAEKAWNDAQETLKNMEEEKERECELAKEEKRSAYDKKEKILNEAKTIEESASKLESRNNKLKSSINKGTAIVNKNKTKE